MTPRTLLTAALLAGCILLLQYHSIQFWTAHVSPVTGAAWSLLLEGAALWLWSSARASRRALGALVTVLLLAGPLYHVSAPLIDDAERTGLTATAGADRAAAIQGEIKTLEGALATYLANSEKRQGWVTRIDHTQARIEQLRTEQANLTAERAKPAQHQPWQRTAVVIMEALAIVIFQLTAVLCIGELRDSKLAQFRKLNSMLEQDATAETPQAAPRRTRRAAHGNPVNFTTATTKQPAARGVA